jgi:threonine aldolase
MNNWRLAMTLIDLRSDTVTLPTPAMREAISRAELGDDVFGEDPTINRLEAMTAERLGKEAALLVVSGTMGNITCVLTHCARGEEVILGDSSHIFLNEAGGISALGGVFPHTIPNQPDGTLRLDEIEAAIRSENIHFPRSRPNTPPPPSRLQRAGGSWCTLTAPGSSTPPSPSAWTSVS